MKFVKIIHNKEDNNSNVNIKYAIKTKSLFNYYTIIFLFSIMFIINIFLLKEYKKNVKILKEIINYKNTTDHSHKNFENDYPYNNKEFIGLYYPDIHYQKIKSKLKNYNIIESLILLIDQIEKKMIFLEKEINLTKIISFYTSRKLYLNEKHIAYDEKNITQLHEIINWIIIHKSNQLKGIASDKYLSCKYVELKLGKNLCEQRIAVYNRFEELNYNQLKKYGNIALKISNSCWKTVFISNNTTKEIFEKQLKNFKKLLYYDHGLLDMQFFHLYAKKRIIIEKQFLPLTDLYEFKFYIINGNIKFIYFEFILQNNKKEYMIYDDNYNFLFKYKTLTMNPINIISIFNKNILEQLKKYAIKLSEDFPNFIRVDLYVFHDKIYFSELTFASYFGYPMHEKEKFIRDAVMNFSRIDDYY